MSQRPGIQVTTQTPADGGEQPNKYPDEVSAHIRVYWPLLATPEQIYGALDDAHSEASDAIAAKLKGDE